MWVRKKPPPLKKDIVQENATNTGNTNVRKRYTGL